MTVLPRALLTAATAGGLLLACVTEPVGPQRAEDPPSVRDPVDTREASAGFEVLIPGSAQLMAGRLSIEGPPELLEHLAVLQAADRIESSTVAKPEGLYSVHRVIEPGVDWVAAPLDAWSLVVFEELEVLIGEPGRKLTLRAEGRVRLVMPSQGIDQVADRMEFTLERAGGPVLLRADGGARRVLED